MPKKGRTCTFAGCLYIPLIFSDCLQYITIRLQIFIIEYMFLEIRS